MRDAVARQSELGQQAVEYLKTGALVPDEIIVGLVGARLRECDCARGFVLDGFPRTVAQAESLEEILKKDALKLDGVFAIRVPQDEIIRRLSGRRICKSCGALFHLLLDPPIKAGRCDKCGGALLCREDDSERIVIARLNVYDKQTSPLTDYYRDRGILREIEGVGAVEEIRDQILKALGEPAA